MPNTTSIAEAIMARICSLDGSSIMRAIPIKDKPTKRRSLNEIPSAIFNTVLDQQEKTWTTGKYETQAKK